MQSSGDGSSGCLVYESVSSFTDAEASEAQRHQAILNCDGCPFADGIADASKKFSDESTKSPKSTAKAVGELREAGLTMDPRLVYFAAVNEALTRMIASATSDILYLFSAFPENEELQMKFLADNNLGETEAAYGAFVGLTDAMRAASMDGAAAPVVAAPSGGPVATPRMRRTPSGRRLIGATLHRSPSTLRGTCDEADDDDSGL